MKRLLSLFTNVIFNWDECLLFVDLGALFIYLRLEFFVVNNFSHFMGCLPTLSQGVFLFYRQKF